MNLFGRKKKEAPVAAPSIIESIAGLNDAKVQLEKRQTHLEKQAAAFRQQAKDRLRAKDKRGAMQMIRRSKLMDGEVDKILGQLNNIDTQIFALQGAASTKDVFNKMRVGKDALKHHVLPNDVDNVADVMEDINESIAMADELSGALAQPIGPAMDEDELTNELAEMENDIADEQLGMKDVQKEPHIPAIHVTAAATTTAAAATAPAARQPVTVTDNDINTLPTPSTRQISASPVPSTSSSSSATTAAAGKKPALSKAEEDELKQLESLMS